MDIYQGAEELLKSMKKFDVAADGESNDDEHDAAVAMQSEILAFLNILAVSDPKIEEMLMIRETEIIAEELDDE